MRYLLKVLSRIVVIAGFSTVLALFFLSTCSKPPIQVDWITLQGGTLEMGSPVKGADLSHLPPRSLSVHIPEEQPRHQVTLASFSIMRNEVTVEQYRKCVTAGACTAPQEVPFTNYYMPERARHPVQYIVWSEARRFCQWTGGRLPSESEWEYAARGGGQEIMYPWGNEPPSCDKLVRWDSDAVCEGMSTQPVCSKWGGTTPQGVCDMAGNVWEWMEDAWFNSYENAPRDGSARLSSPLDPRKVLRGGGISSTADYRTTHRVGHLPDFVYPGLGFRCVK